MIDKKVKSLTIKMLIRRVFAALTAVALIFAALPAVETEASDFIPSNNITSYGKKFVELCEGQKWFLNEIERILNQQQKTINRITGAGDLDFIFALGFAGKGLTGKIPAAIGELHNIRHIFLSDNNITGAIPDEIYTLAKLETLDLAKNKMTGTISSDIKNLVGLKVLNLWGNGFTGTIPSEIGGLLNAENIDLSYNKLTGEIPNTIGNLRNLFLFSASNNGLAGEIPAQIANCSSLKVLILWNNKLTGDVPSGLANLTRLEILDLAQNQLTGELSPTLSVSLREISVRNNLMEGEIPAQYGDLVKLEVFDIHHNSFTGTIPTGFANMPEMRKFDIAETKIGGVIPDFQSTGKLRIAWVYDNKLTGCVPQAFLDCQNDLTLTNATGGKGGDVDVSKNYLTGDVAKQIKKNADNFTDGANTFQNRIHVNSWLQISPNQESNVYALFVTRDATSMANPTSKQKLAPDCYILELSPNMTAEKIQSLLDYYKVASLDELFELRSDDRGLYIKVLKKLDTARPIEFVFRIKHNDGSDYSRTVFKLTSDAVRTDIFPVIPTPSPIVPSETPTPTPTPEPTESGGYPSNPSDNDFQTHTPTPTPPVEIDGTDGGDGLAAAENGEGTDIAVSGRHEPYINGYSDGTIRPDAELTREEAAQLLYNVIGRPAPLVVSGGESVRPSVFADVSEGRWSYEAITYLAQIGVLNGQPNGAFEPERVITRAEFMVIVCLNIQLPLPYQRYTDLTHWAWRYVIAMTNAGYATNYPDGAFRPDGSVTRAEAVSLFNRVFERRPDEAHIDEHIGQVYPDLPKEHWAYYEMTEAATGHHYCHKIEEDAISEEVYREETWVRKAGK